jgi:hypothetical protein
MHGARVGNAEAGLEAEGCRLLVERDDALGVVVAVADDERGMVLLV